MSASLRFVLRVQIPDEVDAFTWQEIEETAEPQDVTNADAIARWLGDQWSTIEAWADDSLPEGWYVKIDGMLP